MFVHRTAPGDRIRLALTKEAGRWARGRIVELVQSGPRRREAPCPYYDRCGGCTLQHLEYSTQVESKGRVVTDALRRIGGLEAFPEPELVASPVEWRYRNRVTFTLRRSGASVTAGFHALEDPRRVVDVDERCLLPEGPLGEAWGALRRSWGPGAVHLPAGAELHLTLRVTRQGAVLLLVEGGRGRGNPERLLEQAAPLRAIWKARARRGASARLLAGEGRLEEEWFGERIDLLPGAFLQGNRAAAERLHEAVLGELGSIRGKRLLDAYCGFGLYGLLAARAGAKVVGIESDPGALRLAERFRAEGLRVLAGTVGARLAEALPVDVAILNPPRVGVEPGVAESLAGGVGERIVYVSCDPATLARDVRRMGDVFRITRLQVFDLLPQTAHAEVVLTLDRGR